MLNNPHNNLNKSHHNPKNGPNRSKPKQFKPIGAQQNPPIKPKKKQPKSKKWANHQTDPNKTSANPKKT